MEVQLVVRKGTDLSAILAQYPDLWNDDDYDEEFESYWCGISLDECASNQDEWMTYDECIEFCGFAEGAIPEADTCLEGTGQWAMSMMRRRDFSRIVGGEAEWRDTSNRYWEAFERGRQAILAST